MMNYETDDKLTSIENMDDTLRLAMEYHVDCGDIDSANALYEEWVIDDEDDPDKFFFVENMTLTNWNL